MSNRLIGPCHGLNIPFLTPLAFISQNKIRIGFGCTVYGMVSTKEPEVLCFVLLHEGFQKDSKGDSNPAGITLPCKALEEAPGLLRLIGHRV